MIRVGQADERNMLTVPVLLKGIEGIWSHGKDFHAAAEKFTVLITQARQLRAAVGSHKAAQESQYNGLASIIG